MLPTLCQGMKGKPTSSIRGRLEVDRFAAQHVVHMTWQNPSLVIGKGRGRLRRVSITVCSVENDDLTNFPAGLIAALSTTTICTVTSATYPYYKITQENEMVNNLHICQLYCLRAQLGKSVISNIKKKIRIILHTNTAM